MSDAITIFHNPACGTSRNVLGLLRHAGLQPQVVEYLKTPPDREQLRSLMKAMGLPARAILREKESRYAELGLDDPKWSDEQLLDFVVQNPILMNRPIVVTPLGTKLCRPCEEVLEILPVGPVAPFTKSDGAQVIDQGSRRRMTPCAPERQPSGAPKKNSHLAVAVSSPWKDVVGRLEFGCRRRQTVMQL